MSPKLLLKTSSMAITLVIMGVLSFPTPANAGFFDGLLDTFGIGNSNQVSGYSYDATAEQHSGDIEISKRGRRVERDQDYHESLTVRSGELVEVRLAVKNSSSQVVNAVVRDSAAGGFVYVKNSLTVNGQSVTGGLTSGGIQVNIPAKSTTTIYYRMNVCSAGYVTTASVYASGIGSGTDGLAIQMENDNYGYYYDTSTCLNQFQNINNGNTNGTPAFYGGPLSDWSGVNNSSNTSTSYPFAGWTGVNNSTSTTSTTNNPFGGWTGINNANGSTFTSSNPFGGWTGVNNNTTSSSSSNPFSGWAGVNNSNVSTSSANNPFGGWTGVNNNSTSTSVNSTNPFSGWTGVSNSGSVSTATNNPFGGWTGVNNANSNSVNSDSVFGTWSGVNNNGSASTSNINNPFGDWTGVNNANTASQSSSTNSNIFGTWSGVNNNGSASTSNINNPFGDWTGVSNSNTTGTASNNDPFGTWTGVNNNDGSSGSSSSNDVFGEWTGVNNFDSRGYQTNTSNTASSEQLVAYNDATASPAPTRFIAPTTGIDKAAPFIFAGLLTAGFVLFKKRKLLFN